MKTKKLALGLFIILIAAITLSGCTTEPAKIGLMDMKQVLEESERAQELQKELTEIGNKLQEEFNKGEEDLGEEEKEKKQEEIYQEYTRQKNQLEKQLNDEIDRVLAEISEDQNIDIVLDDESAHYGGVDITSEVVERLDQSSDKEEGEGDE